MRLNWFAALLMSSVWFSCLSFANSEIPEGQLNPPTEVKSTEVGTIPSYSPTSSPKLVPASNPTFAFSSAFEAAPTSSSLVFATASPTPLSTSSSELSHAQSAKRVCSVKFQHEFWVVSNNDSGVISNVQLNNFWKFDFGKRFDLLVGSGLSLGDQWGLALLGLSAEFKLDEVLSHFTLGVQQERWSSWRVTENRAVGYWTLTPFPSLSLSLGYAYRAPQYNGMGISSLSWPSDDAEYGVLYRFEWKLFEAFKLFNSAFSLSFLIYDYDRMRLYTWDNIHFTVMPELQITQAIKLRGMLGTAVEGLSGAVVSWDQYQIGLGAVYGF